MEQNHCVPSNDSRARIACYVNSLRGLVFVFIWMAVGIAQAQSPPARDASQLTALRSEMRGLAQMVLQLRKQVRALKKQHRTAIAQLKRQHNKAIQQLRQGKNAPAQGTSTQMAALQRSVKALAHQVETLRAQVRSNRRQMRTKQTKLARRWHKRPLPALRRKRGISVSGREYARGYYMLTFTPSRHVTRIEYRLRHQKNFRSTGLTHIKNPATGQPYPKMYIMTRYMKQGKNDVEVRTLDSRGKWSPISRHRVHIQPKRLSDADLFMRYQWSNPVIRQVRYRLYKGRLWFLFFWASNPKIFRKASYSFGTPSLHNQFIVNGKKGKGKSILIRKGITPGSYTLHARFSLLNGKIGPLLSYQLNIKSDGRWYNAHP